ncbi:AMP-binding protein [Streptomyces sp. R-07]|uniref:AMP-binding protein n=1 Tax=unclassified Streptomyces TaxID=2593676 RepID=UPI0037D170D7
MSTRETAPRRPAGGGAEFAAPDVRGALAAVAPPPDVANAYRSHGWWRTDTFATDLRRTAARFPRRAAIVQRRTHRPPGQRTTVLDYGRLDLYVDRFAAALASLGVRTGDPVAYQLPNRWETAALFLACLRLGAVAVPVLPTVRARGLHRVLEASQARICVVPDVWEGFPHEEVLAESAAGLPWLRHRVVARAPWASRAAGRHDSPGPHPATGPHDPAGAVDFDRYFLRTPHERGPYGRRSVPYGEGTADRVCLMVTVTGTGENFRSVLHTANTLYAAIGAQDDRTGPGRRLGEVFYSALPLTSLASTLYAVCWPLAVGGTGVYEDVWTPGGCLDLMDTARVDQAYASPAHWAEVLAAQRRRPRALDSLRLVLSGGRTSTPEDLLSGLPEALGAPVRGVWGAPELGMGTLTRGDIPAEREGASDGVPLAGLEVSPLPGRDAAPGEVSPLRVRGPSVCLATWRHGDAAPVATWDTDGGWLDTGDLARPDGLGGLRVTGRAGSRTGALFMVPVDLVERELLTHPGVGEAAVIGHTDQELGERPCAVVVPAAEETPPSLLALREHLAARGTGEAFLPTRLELVGSLPRDERGAVRRDWLRSWLERLRPGQPRTAPTRGRAVSGQ